MIITASAATAVVLVIVLVAAVLLNTGDNGGGAPTGTPGEVARAYLEAVSRGDAEAALAMGASEPATSDLLTDEILKRQLELAALRDIEILSETPHKQGDGVGVKVSAKIGDQRTEGQIDVTPVNGEWKLVSSFVDAQPMSVIDDEWSVGHVMRIFDKPLDESGHFYAFPGAVSVSTTSPYIDVNKPAPLGLDLGGVFGQHPEFKFSLNEKGRPAAEEAMRAWISKCYSPVPKTPGCAKLTNFEPEFDSATTQLTGPLDLRGLKYEYNGAFTYVMVTGTVPDVPFSIRQNSDGQTVPLIVDLSVVNRVDISTEPAVVNEPPQ
ncbi:hypothetical protein ACQI4L_27470 [Mycolicibacterium litorale]|uniref:hypothetical protein n=1 Tax=Mycolicibacterium litorale TaxID=758802 RepID=UPI003CF88A3F